MNIVIETERLILRPLQLDDAAAVFKWGGDPKVNQYMIYPLYNNVEEVRKWLQMLNPNDPDNYDLGFVLKETKELIGTGGLVYNQKKNAWIVGYNLRADQWGNGYTVEAITAIIDEISKTRMIRAIEGEVATENLNSIRIVEKLGMQFVAKSEYTKLDGSAYFEANRYRKEL